jgi:hypothetical protein
VSLQGERGSEATDSMTQEFAYFLKYQANRIKIIAIKINHE